jgi:dolichol kinase
MTSELLEDKSLVLQLHGVLAEIDPVRFRAEAAVSLAARLRELQRRFHQRARLAELSGALDRHLPTLEEPATDLRSRWLAFKKQLVPAYEKMAARLRAEKVHVPSLRPTNWARSLLHLGSATVAVALIELCSPGVTLAIALAWGIAAWAMELGRRNSKAINGFLMKVLGPVAHAHETYRINSATWYATALVGLAALHHPAVAAVAVGILGVGDPIAGLIGRRFGRIKLVNNRSLEGTLAFFVSGAVVAFALLRAFHPAVGLGLAFAIAALASLFGALAELLSRRVDDNFSVPVSAAAGAALAWALLG